METSPQALYDRSRAAFRKGDLREAALFADQLVLATGESSQAMAWAARIRLAGRDWSGALAIVLQAIKKEPTSELHGLLGQTQVGLGEDELAEAAFSEASRLQPDYAPWKYQRALVLLRLQRDFEAMDLLRQGAAITPNANCLFRLAELELNYSDPTASLAAAERALTMEPSDAMGHTVAASGLQDLGREAEADAHWESARSLAKPDSEQVDLIRARYFVQRGDMDKGAAILEDLIDRYPDRPAAYARLAANKKFNSEDLKLVDKMTDLTESGQLADADRMQIEYSLGKAHDDLGQYESAMSHFNRANRLARRSIEERGGFNRDEFSDIIAIRKHVLCAESVAKLRRIGNPTEMPVFVMGMMRSGTTLAERILASHPAVQGAGEQSLWINADHRLTDFRAHRLNELLVHETSALYMRLLARYANGADRVVDKQPGNLILAGILHIAFPNAKIVYMRRNPVDNAISIWNTHIRTTTPFVNDKSNIVYAFKQYDDLFGHWKQVIPADRLLEVSYEGLILDRENTTRRILEFCGLPWSDSCLEPEKHKGLVTTPSVWQVRQSVYRTSVDRWRNYEPWLDEFRELLQGES